MVDKIKFGQGVIESRLSRMIATYPTDEHFSPTTEPELATAANICTVLKDILANGDFSTVTPVLLLAAEQLMIRGKITEAQYLELEQHVINL
jgi:hypothetical protein